MLIAFSISPINPNSPILDNKHSNTILVALANERLTVKQKQILTYLLNEKPQTTVTRTIHILARQLECSYSALWLSLSQLKRIGLVEYGSQTEKGKPLILTPIGHLITQKLKLKQNHNQMSETGA